MTIIRIKSKIIKIFLAGILFCSSTCKKEDYSQVPYAYVNIELNVYNELSAVGVGEFVLIRPAPVYGQVIIYDPFRNVEYPPTGGSFTGKGIILYHYNPSEWNAYDNTCTYKPQTDSAHVITYKDSIYAVCPKCKSRFLMVDGSPMKGSLAPRPLKQYRTIVDGYGNLIISN